MIFYLLIAAIDFIVGLLALSKRGNKAAYALALFCFSTCVWSLELFLLTYLQDLDTLDFWFHLTRLGMFLIPPSLALLVLQLVRAHSTFFRRFIIYPGFAIALAQFAFNITLYPSTLRPVVGGYLPKPDWIYYSFIVNFGICFVASIIFATVIYQSAAGRDKQRIKWLLIIVVVTFLSGAASLYLVAYDFYLSKFIGATTNAVFMLLLFYATVQHHLVDIRMAVTMAISRMVLLAIFAGIYLLLGLSMSGSPSDAGTLLVFGLLSILALEFYPRALEWLEPNTKRLFLASNYDYHRVVATTGVQLKRCSSYKELSQLLDHFFNRVICVKGYHVYLFGQEIDAQYAQAMPINNASNGFRVKCEDLRLAPHLGRSSVVMVDEVQSDLRQQLSEQSAVCFLPMLRDGQLQAVVLVGASSIYSYYRYDDVRLMEWLVGELSQTLYRIATHEKLDTELAEAKKRLSMLAVMNLYHHDIKAPLSIIDGVVSNDLYDDEKRRSVILEQVAWGSRLITTMAELLRGDRKRKVGPVVLQEVLDDCCFVFKRSLENLTVEHAGTFTVQADADDLKILFINVIKNAVEALQPDQALELHVRTWSSPQGVYVAITDNGIGMSPQQLDCLWLNQGSTKPGGNGIGLQAIKKIADEHGATINVSSAPGVGTTFTFRFPVPERDLGALIGPQNSLA